MDTKHIKTMKLNTAVDLFEKIKADTKDKSEVKTYKKFIDLLNDLLSKNLSEIQVQKIENKLDLLALDSFPDKKGKYFKKQFANFKKFLSSEFSFITLNYYVAIGMSLGVCFGVAIGQSAFGNSSTGIAVGMAVGLAIGANLDAKAKKEGRVLNVK